MGEPRPWKADFEVSTLGEIADGIGERASDARESLDATIDEALGAGQRVAAGATGNIRATTGNVARTAEAGANAIKWIVIAMILMVLIPTIIGIIGGLAWGGYQLWLIGKGVAAS